MSRNCGAGDVAPACAIPVLDDWRYEGMSIRPACLKTTDHPGIISGNRCNRVECETVRRSPGEGNI